MIPTILLLGAFSGLVSHRGWWFVAVAAVGWPILLVATGSDGVNPLGAGGLGLANAMAGVVAGSSLKRFVMTALDR